jgi:hypothetical protein
MRLLPERHCDPTINNLHDEIHVIDHGKIVGRWKIDLIPIKNQLALITCGISQRHRDTKKNAGMDVIGRR